MSGMVDKVKAKVEQVLHKDSTHSTTTHGHAGTTHNTHTGTTGTHTSGFGTNQSTTAGPHDSNIANKLDPRVDSDRDGAHPGQMQAQGITHGHNTAGGIGGHTGTHTGTHTGAHTGAHTGTTGTYGASEYGSTNQGPHSSNIANKLDPRVDSDRDGAHLGQQQAQGFSQGQTGAYGSHNQTGGLTGTHGGLGSNNAGFGGGHDGLGSTNQTAGPHSSNLANKLDPRVDSDMDGSRTAPGGTY